jgi:Fic family protein
MGRNRLPIRKDIAEVLKAFGQMSSAEVHEKLASPVAYATVKRALQDMVVQEEVQKYGNGRGPLYALNPNFTLTGPIDVEAYFNVDDFDREIIDTFNFDLLQNIIDQGPLFTQKELRSLETHSLRFKQNIQQLHQSEFKTEFERLAIDLSWKSSQIEGNTYSLLETELLLKQQMTASGKTKDEAVMLLNHKDALDFLLDHPNFIEPLKVRVLEDVHSMLIKELGVQRNIRNRRVGISGTMYKPLDNEHQIREALQAMCDLINQRDNVWEKALLALLLISYIQPFDDGNKRTGRIVSNAILMYHRDCPLSFRTIDPIAYKKALLIFYERNNLSAFKKIFIEQFEFAVKTYF